MQHGTNRDEFLRRLWKRLDKDGSGTLTQKELNSREFHDVIKSAVSGRGSSGKIKMNFQNAVNLCVQKADHNGDGNFTFEEFKSLVNMLQDEHHSRNDGKLTFALFDLNGNQTLSRQEFDGLFRFMIGRNPMGSEVDDEWELLVRNKPDDGKAEASFEEYIGWLTVSNHPDVCKHAPPAKDGKNRASNSQLEILQAVSDTTQSLRQSRNRPAAADVEAAPDSAQHLSSAAGMEVVIDDCIAEAAAAGDVAATAAAAVAANAGAGEDAGPRRSCSVPLLVGGRGSVSPSRLKSLRRTAGDHPFLSKQILVRPKQDRHGCRTVEARSPQHARDWDDRLVAPPDNELLPKGRRSYFQRPQTITELKDDLIGKKNSGTIMRRLEQEERPPSQASKISCDSGAPLFPERHVYGGSMRDRDGETRIWNDRWHTGIQMINENLHPSHRMAFTQRSLFEASPSQRWRRFLDYETDHGVWRPIESKRGARFPPLGV